MLCVMNGVLPSTLMWVVAWFPFFLAVPIPDRTLFLLVALPQVRIDQEANHSIEVSLVAGFLLNLARNLDEFTLGVFSNRDRYHGSSYANATGKVMNAPPPANRDSQTSD